LCRGRPLPNFLVGVGDLSTLLSAFKRYSATVIELTSTVTIRQPPSVVYAVLTDFERYLARWADGPIAAQKTSPGPLGPGTTFKITAKVGPFRMPSPYEVLVWEPPTRFGGRGIAGPVRFAEEYRLNGGAGSTELQQSIRAGPRGPFGFAEEMIRRRLKQLIPADLERLKALVEEEAPPGRSSDSEN
jgi:hypothetical protein